MMRMIFAVVYILLVALLAVSCVEAGKKKNRLSLPVIKVTMAGAVATFFYALFLMVPITKIHLAVFLTGMHYIAIDWMIYNMTNYIMAYTDSKLITSMPRYIVRGLLVLDSLSILINNFTYHVFTMDIVFSESTGEFYFASQAGSFMAVHFALCYGMVILIFIALIYKLVISPRMYRKKYSVVIAFLTAGVIINAVCFIVRQQVDFSVFLYSILGPLLCYFTLYQTPRQLVTQTHSYVVEDIGDAIFCFDMDGRCVYINRAAKNLLPPGNEQNNMDMLEKRYYEWRKSYTGDRDCAHWEENIEIAGDMRAFAYEYRNMHDDRGMGIGCFFKIEDKTEDVKRFEEERYRATHDCMTGLYNREGFFEAAKEFVINHADEQMYIIASNIKDFKLVNELFGTDKGDEVLKNLAGILDKSGHRECVTGRIAGDKFVKAMLKEDFDEKLIVDKMEALCSLTEDGTYKMHAYIGVCEVGDVNEPIQTMYDKANMAIDRIKGDYQQVVSFYDESDMKRLMMEKNVVAEFDRAIENKEFILYLQPQVDHTGKALGAEALVRWQHPQRGLLYPNSFIGILERAGLIYKLDNYIWETSAQRLKMWKNAGLEQYHISVNISAKDFYYLDLYEVFTGLVKKYDINPARLNLEITETVIMADVKMHMEVISKLQEFGFHIEIDDFGSGYSSLNTLKDIKADVLKIDMLFLRDTENQSRSKAILSSVISMAKTLNMPVITEGVETKNQVDFLSVMGCEMFQGYYFSKPVPVKEFEQKYFK